jgi:NADPH:quinone reductase-like Zn-dependent oxidoreductase
VGGESVPERDQQGAQLPALVVGSPESLKRLGALLADGTLQIPVQTTYQLAQAPEALGTLTGQHTQGKLAIRVR